MKEPIESNIDSNETTVSGLLERGVMPACNCECIDPASDPCMAESEDNYICTRKAGHDGNHTACGGEHMLKTWEQA